MRKWFEFLIGPVYACSTDAMEYFMGFVIRVEIERKGSEGGESATCACGQRTSFLRSDPNVFSCSLSFSLFFYFARFSPPNRDAEARNAESNKADRTESFRTMKLPFISR